MKNFSIALLFTASFLALQQKGLAEELVNHPIALSSLVLVASSYDSLSAHEKKKTLSKIIQSMKTYDPTLYQDILRKLTQLKSNNLNSIHFVKNYNCRDGKIEEKKVSPVISHTCLKLKYNAKKKLDHLKRDIEAYLTPNLFALEVFIEGQQLEHKKLSSSRVLIKDLKKALKRIDKIEHHYQNADYPTAQTEIDLTLSFFGESA